MVDFDIGYEILLENKKISIEVHQFHLGDCDSVMTAILSYKQSSS